MPANRGGTNWSVLISGGALLVAVGVPAINALTGGTEKLEKRVATIEDALTWKYVSKELAAKDLTYTERTLTDLKSSKVDRDVYDMLVANHERRLNFLRDAIRELEKARNNAAR